MSTHNLKKIRLKTIKYLKKLACISLKIFLALILYYLVGVASVLFKIENYLWQPDPILIESKSIKTDSVITKPLRISHGCFHGLKFYPKIPDKEEQHTFAADILLTIIDSNGTVKYSKPMRAYFWEYYLDGPNLDAGDYKILLNVRKAQEHYPFEYFSLDLKYGKDGCQRPFIMLVPEQIKMFIRYINPFGITDTV
nr:hypothetical protein [uncultured Enterobacter sp.]